MLCGLLSPESGEVSGTASQSTCNGRHISRRSPISAIAAPWKDELTTLENLLVSSALGGFELGPTEAQRALECLQLDDQKYLPARHLSEGQRRRLALARLVNCRRALWLLDEVMTSLDVLSARSIAALIDSLSAEECRHCDAS